MSNYSFNHHLVTTADVHVFPACRGETEAMNDFFSLSVCLRVGEDGIHVITEEEEHLNSNVV